VLLWLINSMEAAPQLRKRTSAAVRASAQHTRHTLALAELASLGQSPGSRRAAAAAIAQKYPGENAKSLKRHLERHGWVVERTNEHQLLSDLQEQVILGVARTFSVANRALSRAQYISLAREMAGKPMNWSGQTWYRGFAARHADSLQPSHSQAMAPKRNRGELRGMVEAFLRRMQLFFTLHTFSGEATWSADETLLSIHLSSQSPVRLEAVGKINHNHVVPTGMHYGSMLLFSNAAGHTPLVVIILPQTEQYSSRQRTPEFYLPDLQPKPSNQRTVLFAFTPSGRMVTSLFRVIMERFVSILRERSPGVDQQIYLDRLGAHLDPVMVRHAHENGLHVCWYPPDCSEFLQPCDDVMFATFKQVLASSVRSCDAQAVALSSPLSYFLFFLSPVTCLLLRGLQASGGNPHITYWKVVLRCIAGIIRQYGAPGVASCRAQVLFFHAIAAFLRQRDTWGDKGRCSICRNSCTRATASRQLWTDDILRIHFAHHHSIPPLCQQHPLEASCKGTSLKGSTRPRMEAVKTLIAQRDAIELEIDSLREWLQAPGRPGLKGGLVDKDGFPLEDVDLVIKTRDTRHRLACKAIQLSPF
jgi:hypothetical protein